MKLEKLNLIRLFLLIACAGFLAVSAPAQKMQNRRMILDRYDCAETAAASGDEDSRCLVELVDIRIGNQKIISGEIFSADENWLKNLRVRIKNVSGKPFVYAGVGFGLLEGLREELAPGASWRWGFALARGKASNRNDEKKKISKRVILRPNQEIELTFADLVPLYKKSGLMQVVGKMNQIVLVTATVEFQDGRQEDSHLFVRKK